MTFKNINLILIIQIFMQKIVTIQQKRINNKNYLVPQFNLFGCQKYMLPKLDNAPVHHTFFNPKDIDQLYREQNLDPEELQCNLKFQPELPSKINQQKSHASHQSEVPQSMSRQPSKESQAKLVPAKNRPKLRENGPTHFIHIPLEQHIGDTFDSLIKPQIEQGNLDVLVGRKSLHATILTFRIRSLDDIPAWQKILKCINLKKAKVYIKGVDIFPVKKSYTRVLYLNINGLDDIIDTVVSRALNEGLVNQKQLDHIYFDKQSQTFKMQKQHVTLMKTRGDDLIDGAPYIKSLGKINLGKININKIAMSMIGTFNQKDGYFDEIVHESE